MATHVRRLTFVVDQESSFKTEGCCFNTETDMLFLEAQKYSNKFGPFLAGKPNTEVCIELFDVFKLKIFFCAAAIKDMPEGKRKNYLNGRVQLWNQKAIHIESKQANLPKITKFGQFFHVVKTFDDNDSKATK